MGDVNLYQRKPGLASVGELVWGTHFCLFYQTKEDLLDVLVPYLKAGLENNEFCVWVVSSPLSLAAARKVLKSAVRDFEQRTKNGQIRIVSPGQWGPDGQAADAAITAHVNKALARGFDGLRFAGHALPDGPDGKRFVCHGAGAVSRDNAVAAFAYPRDEFDAVGLMDVVKRHRLALVRNAGAWEPIETSEARVAKDALARTEQKLHSVFSNMSEGFAFHRIVLDTQGSPRDYVFLEVNEAFEQLTGRKARDLVGRKATELWPGLRRDPADWIGRYGKVALEGKPLHFEARSDVLGKWVAVSAFSPQSGFFAATLSDITARKEAQEQLAALNDELSASNEELRVETETRAALEEELRASNEELQAQMDELEQTEHARRATALFPEQNPSPVLRVMYDGTLGFANAAGKRLLRTWRCQVGGLVPDEIRRAVEAALDRRRLGEIEVTCGRTTYAFAVAPICAEGYANFYGYDVTNRKEAEQALRESNEELERFNRAMVGRELRTIELKKEVNELYARTGQPQRYPLEFEKEQ